MLLFGFRMSVNFDQRAQKWLIVLCSDIFAFIGKLKPYHIFSLFFRFGIAVMSQIHLTN